MLPAHPTERLVGQAPTIQALRTQIRHLAAFDVIGNVHIPTVLLHGETGTGKGLVARALHDSGPRAHGPFVDVNCAAIPETMLEAELFGFEAGAFTDAKRAKAGLFEAASGGTLFLDEIDAVPLVLQSKLLKILEEKRLRRLGAITDRAVDVKLIAATAADLPARVAEGRFRLDLYHRLAVVLLELPPLRARGEDVLGLARQFLAQYAAGHRVAPKRLTPEAEAWLARQAWPGNVRELSHLLERVTLLHPDDVIDAAALERFCLPRPPGASPPGTALPTTTAGPLDEPSRIRQALIRSGGNVVRAAALLGLRRDALRYRMRRYGITPPSLADLTAALLPQPTAPESHGDPSEAAADPLSTLQPAVSTESAPGWEQKPVAVLAIDVTWPEASALGAPPHEPWTLVARWEQGLVEKVRGFGGVVLQHTPSLLVAAFGVPQTLEQQPQRAVHAALALRQLAADGGAAIAEGPCPALRLGLHWGPLLVAPQASEQPPRVRAVGETLAVPVRLLGHAAPGEVLASATLARLAERWCALTPRTGAVDLERADHLEVYTVVGVQSGPEYFTALALQQWRLFVGRARELTALTELWARAQAGHGQVICIVGEPGVGKSRLLAEFLRAAQLAGTRLLETRAAAYTQTTPYHPIIDLLRRYMGIEDRDDWPTVRAKLTRQLTRLELPYEPMLSPLLNVLGGALDDPRPTLDPALRRQRTLEAIRQVLLRESQEQPLLLVVEDLHWSDHETQAVLDRLVDSVSGVPFFLLATARPEYAPPWGGRPGSTLLRLEPLAPGHAEVLLDGWVGTEPALHPLKARLVECTQGNPFFLEETVHTLVEAGVLTGSHGAYALAQPVDRLQVPATVQAVLAARLDRLDWPEKDLLHILAVLGPECTLPLLTAVMAQPEGALRERLTRLQRAEFVYERLAQSGPVYTFRHALTQEVAYQAVPVHTRQQSHRHIAQVLEAQFPGTVESQPELLAHHYTEAGLVVQAIHYWQRAGQRAIEHSGYVDAIEQLTKGLALLNTLPDTPERARHELRLQTALGSAFIATKGHASPDVEHVYARAAALGRQVGDTLQQFEAIWGLRLCYLVRGALHRARELGEQLLHLAQGVEDPVLLLSAHQALGTTLFEAGELLPAHTHLLQGLTLDEHAAQRVGHAFHIRDLGVACHAYTALTSWCLGYRAQALQRGHEALTRAQELRHPFSLASALFWTALLAQCCQDAPVVYERAEALMALATEHGFAQRVASGMVLCGWALAAQGHGTEALTHLHQGITAYHATGAEWLPLHHLALLAEAYANVGQIADGLRVLAEPLGTTYKGGERYYEAELHRLKGTLLLRLAMPDATGAEQCFQQALIIARRQQAKSWELRAAVSLASLWQQQGKRAEAHELLGPIYSWFTEGFDTADLQVAQVLLDALL
jgi:DNA-binding NtrC family response regulator/predicted ATPase/class 3 adenylate cyclase